MVFKYHVPDCSGPHPIAVLHHLAAVEILHRKMVRADCESTTHGWEAGRFQCFTHTIDVIGIPIYRGHCASDVMDGVIALRRIEAWVAVVLSLESVNELFVLICTVIEI